MASIESPPAPNPNPSSSLNSTFPPTPPTSSSAAPFVSTSTTNNENSSRNSKNFDEYFENMPPGKLGTYASYFATVSAMVAAIIAQRYAETVQIDAWLSSCPSGYESSCQSNGAVLRFSFALVVLFGIQLIGTTIWTRFYDSYWFWKIIGFVGLVVGFFYTKAEVFDLHGYAWFARIAGFFFIILQQVILLDFAYLWNEKWVKYSEDGNTKWLISLVIVSLLMFAGSFSAMGVMYWQFSGCGANETIISLTLILSVLATLFQLFLTDEGSILTSAIMCSYATYICYSSITLNPDNFCNPTLSTKYQDLSSALGMTILVISLTWATATTVGKVPESVNAPSTLKLSDVAAQGEESYSAPALRTILQEVSIVFLLVSTYFAMVLTNWATQQSSFEISNPKTGTAAMWLQACAMFIAFSLYIWSLIAPKIFPNRDFGHGHRAV